MKGRIFLLEMHISFTTQFCHSILGTCSLELIKLNIGPLGISAISSCMVENPIGVNCRDLEATFKIEDIDAPKGFGYLSGFMCGKVTCSSEVNIAARCEK